MDNTNSLKEEFVTNTTGMLPIEIFLMAGVTLSSFALYAVFQILIKLLKFQTVVHKFAFIVENICIVFPILLAFTLLSNDLFTVNLLLLVIILCILYHLCFHCYGEFLSCLWKCEVGNTKLSYIINYKADIQITTAICILAVDFNIFPRRFAKTEVYGIGIMDMAVGTIIFSHALTSRQSRFQVGVNIDCLFSNLKRSAVLVVLGILRTFVIKQIDYQERVVEYGKHWNFFFTIAVIKPLANFILLVLNCGLRQTFVSLFVIGYYSNLSIEFINVWS